MKRGIPKRATALARVFGLVVLASSFLVPVAVCAIELSVGMSPQSATVTVGETASPRANLTGSPNQSHTTDRNRRRTSSVASCDPHVLSISTQPVTAMNLPRTMLASADEDVSRSRTTSDAAMPCDVPHVVMTESSRRGTQNQSSAKPVNGDSASSASIVKPNGPRTIASFKVGRKGRMLLLPVLVGVKEYRFALDTGAEITVFDTTLEDALKATSQSANALTIDGSSTIELFEAPALTVGEFNIRPLAPVACMNLSKLRMVSGEPVFGILGMDVLQGLVISIDFDLGKVEFLTHADESAGLPIRIEYQHHRIPTVTADLPEDDKVPFVIDTGLSSIGMLHETTFDRLRQAGLISNISESMRLTLSGITRHQIGTLATCELAGTQHTSLTFDRANHNVLGLGLLSRYKITLDFPRRTAYLRKGLRFAAPDVRDLSGMHVVQVDEKIVIDHIDPESAAAQSGLRAQDLLVTVDNLVAKPGRLFEIRQLLGAPNPSLPVVFRREGRIETTTLCLKRD